MSDYRITSSNFVTPGESSEPNAILSPEDLAFVGQHSGTDTKNAKLAAFLKSQIEKKEVEPIDIEVGKKDK